MTVHDFYIFQRYLIHRYTANIEGNNTFVIFLFFNLSRKSTEILFNALQKMDFSQKALIKVVVDTQMI